MSGGSWGTRRTVIVVLIVVAVGAVLVAFWLWPDDRSRAVPTDEVVRNYRASSIPTTSDQVPSSTIAPSTAASTTSATTAPTTAVGTTAASSTVASSTTEPTLELPEPGVYRYATSGWEDVDALNGARHDYPDETTITVTDEGCGVRLRWDALRERRDEWRLCATELGIELQPDAIQYHEFFQQPELEHLDCDRSVVVVPAGAPPTDPVVQSCFLEQDPWIATWTAPEPTTHTVAGNEVPAWHVQMTVDDDDQYWEHTTLDWFFDDRGLPVAMASTKESNSPSPIGDVLYRENYELSAVSLTPLR